MNTKRIKEIQSETAYPNSISVQQALMKVWNECEQDKNKQSTIKEILKKHNLELKDLARYLGMSPRSFYHSSAKERYKKAFERFYNEIK